MPSLLQEALRDPHVSALLTIALMDNLPFHFKDRHDRKQAREVTDCLFDALNSVYQEVGSQRHHFVEICNGFVDLEQLLVACHQCPLHSELL